MALVLLFGHPDVILVLSELEHENTDIPVDVWREWASELSDSRRYYDGTHRDPNYDEAMTQAKELIQAWRRKQQQTQQH